MHPKTLEALEEIDAALLSGDEFENPESLALFRSYLASWTRVTQSMVATFRATLTTDATAATAETEPCCKCGNLIPDDSDGMCEDCHMDDK
jgi:hypothetical protein